MKKIFILILVIIIFTGCRYKEGPMISFRSIEKRLKGDWNITSFTSNGADSLKYYNDSSGAIISFIFPQDEDYCVLWLDQGITYRAIFSFSDNKKSMNVNFGDYTSTILGPIGNGKSKWDILKLTSKEFKITTYFKEKTYEILFIKK